QARGCRGDCLEILSVVMCRVLSYYRPGSAVRSPNPSVSPSLNCRTPSLGSAVLVGGGPKGGRVGEAIVLSTDWIRTKTGIPARAPGNRRSRSARSRIQGRPPRDGRPTRRWLGYDKRRPSPPCRGPLKLTG